MTLKLLQECDMFASLSFAGFLPPHALFCDHILDHILDNFQFK